jgi:hypothetical protein
MKWLVTAVAVEYLIWLADQKCTGVTAPYLTALGVTVVALLFNGLWVWSLSPPKLVGKMENTCRQVALGAFMITAPLVLLVSLQHRNVQLTGVRLVALIGPSLIATMRRVWRQFNN